MKQLQPLSFLYRTSIWCYGLMMTATLLVSCQIEEPVPELEIAKEEGIYILNEGNFLRGNASLSFIDFETDEIAQHLYKDANQQALGDVGQSMTQVGDELFIVINNSAKIIVADPNSLKKKAEIEGFTSPRYMLPVNMDFALVSDLYAKKLWKVDLNNRVIKESMPVAAWIEKMTQAEAKVFATNAEYQHIYVIEPNTLQLTDSIDIGGKSEEIFTDKNGIVWVMRLSNKEKNVKAAWLQIDPTNLKVLRTIDTEIEETAYAASVSYSSSENKAWYILQGEVGELNCETGTISASVITSKKSNLYNIFYHKNKLWITDAKDFNQKGELHRYNLDYQLEKTFEGGIIPGDMLLLSK